ncbi:MAG TPA: gluconokinase [Vicinamibacteria bacterium]|nr:gluconokinase [Vicinamibacteria bacterium]
MAAGWQAPFVLALDVGSSSVKGGLYDARARLVPGTLVSEAAAIRLTLEGAAEADAEDVARRTETVVDGILQRAGRWRPHIAAVGLDTMAFTVAGVDASGRLLTPLFTYADTRPREDVLALAGEIDRRATYQRTGCPLHTGYLPARLRWLRRRQPGPTARVRRWLDVGTWLYTRWFGAGPVPMSYSTASWSGLLDRHRLCWDAELMRHLGLDEGALPPLAEYFAARQGLAPGYGRRWGALRDVPFFLGVGDGAAANVGSGCVSPRRTALTVGTSGALRILLPGRTPEVPAGLWAYKLGSADTLLGGAFSTGGEIFAWARSLLRLPPAKDLDRALSRLPPDGHGLTVLPFLSGERSPGWSPNARAAVDGLGGSATSLQILQACLEAVSYRFGLVARLLAPHEEAPHEIVASGGAMSRSRYWVQLMADVLQRPVGLCRARELTSRGTAVLALRALGAWTTLEDVPVAQADAYEPDTARAAVYAAAMDRQHALYEALVERAAETARRFGSPLPEQARGGLVEQEGDLARPAGQERQRR